MGGGGEGRRMFEAHKAKEIVYLGFLYHFN